MAINITSEPILKSFTDLWENNCFLWGSPFHFLSISITDSLEIWNTYIWALFLYQTSLKTANTEGRWPQRKTVVHSGKSYWNSFHNQHKTIDYLYRKCNPQLNFKECLLTSGLLFACFVKLGKSYSLVPLMISGLAFITLQNCFLQISLHPACFSGLFKSDKSLSRSLSRRNEKWVLLCWLLFFLFF